jgi:hypothetical protein
LVELNVFGESRMPRYSVLVGDFYRTPEFVWESRDDSLQIEGHFFHWPVSWVGFPENGPLAELIFLG